MLRSFLSICASRSFALLPVAALALIVLWQFESREPIASAETRFVETSDKGMHIVPASCPSQPHYSGDCSTPTAPSDGCVLQASPSSIIQSQSTQLSWSSETSTLMPWSRTISPTVGSVNWSGTTTVMPVETTTYTLTMTRQVCIIGGIPFPSGGSGCGIGSSTTQTKTCSATVTVTPACSPAFTCIGNDLYARINPPACTNQFYQACAYGCSNGACNSPGGGFDGNIIVSPSLIRAGETTDVSWETTGMSSCAVTEDNTDINDAWTGTSGAPRASSAISQQTTYYLNCTKSGGGTFTDSATVNIIPIFQEL